MPAATASTSPTRPLVGRARELEELDASLARVRQGHGAVVLLAGEPGIGKTRLAEALAERASAAGALVAWGRCWESGGAPAYWPWIQALRSIPGSDAAVTAELLASPAQTSGGEADDARFARFDAVDRRLRDIALERPLVLVLDDLHSADRASLLLLRFVGRSLADRRLLALGTYREVEARRDPAVVEVIESIATEGTRLPLRGLSEDGVAAMLARRAGLSAGRAFARRVHRATEGNPFFVDEIARLHAAEAPLRTQGSDAARAFRVPAGVREAIRRRLEPLPQGADEVLAIAAVSGREFGLAELAHLSALPTERLASTLEAALEAEVVSELPGAGERYRFVHALIQETLYERLDPAERRALHRQLGELLETLHGDDPTPVLSELALHFDRAEDRARALHYARRAGERAAALLAWEEAAGHFARVLELDADPEPHTRIDGLLALGRARVGAGETDAARAAFAEAAAAARQTADGQRLAAAALGFGSGGESWANGAVDDVLVALLEEALAALPECSSATQARLLSRLTQALYYSYDWERMDALSEKAVTVARGLGEHRPLCEALGARMLALLRPDGLDQRVAIADECLSIAERDGAADLLLGALTAMVIARAESGDVAGLDAAIARATRLAEERRAPHSLWHCRLWQAMRALLDGRLDESERLAGEALALAEGVVPLAGPMWVAQMGGVWRDRGRFDLILPGLRGVVEAYPTVVAWRAALAAVLSHTGQRAESRAELDRLSVDDFGALPRSQEWLPAMGLLAETVTRLEDARDHAEVLYAQLEPYSARVVVSPMASGINGVVAYHLGQLAGVIGRFDAAERHFEDARALHRALGSPSWLARTELERARMLLARGMPADSGAAAVALDAALETAVELGMEGLERDCEELRARMGARAPTDSGAAAAEELVFRREGDVWAIGAPDDPLRLSDLRGLAHVAELLRHPGVEIHAAELAGGAGAGALREGDPGPRLDASARRAYRARVEDLRETIDEAERFGDAERAVAAREELEAVAGELAAATGLGDRDRGAGATAAERARVSVTKAIRAAIGRVGEHDAALAQLLDRSVRTGAFCVYEPDERAPVRWRLS